MMGFTEKNSLTSQMLFLNFFHIKKLFDEVILFELIMLIYLQQYFFFIANFEKNTIRITK